jgi:hypothetical protein
MSKVIVKFKQAYGVYNPGDAAGFDVARAQALVASGVCEMLGAGLQVAELEVDPLEGMAPSEVSSLVEKIASASITSDAVNVKISQMAAAMVEDRAELLACAEAEKTLNTSKVNAQIKAAAAKLVEERVAQMIEAQAASEIAALDADEQAGAEEVDASDAGGDDAEAFEIVEASEDQAASDDEADPISDPETDLPTQG